MRFQLCVDHVPVRKPSAVNLSRRDRQAAIADGRCAKSVLNTDYTLDVCWHLGGAPSFRRVSVKRHCDITEIATAPPRDYLEYKTGVNTTTRSLEQDCSISQSSSNSPLSSRHDLTAALCCRCPTVPVCGCRASGCLRRWIWGQLIHSAQHWERRCWAERSH